MIANRMLEVRGSCESVTRNKITILCAYAADSETSGENI